MSHGCERDSSPMSRVQILTGFVLPQPLAMQRARSSGDGLQAKKCR